MKKYEKMITIIKPNDVLYSRDIHAINIVNAILMSNIDIDIQERFHSLMRKILQESNIEFINEDTYNLFMIQEPGWGSIVFKKKGVFITKPIYDLLKELKMEDFIYNIKLEFINEAQLKNFDLNNNMFLLNDSYIDELKLLENNGCYFNKHAVIKKDDYIKFLMEQVANHVGVTYLYVNIFTGCIDDLMEIGNLLKNDPYSKNVLKNAKYSTVFVHDTKYNRSKITYYNNFNTPQYGLLDLFDINLLSKINFNKVM